MNTTQTSNPVLGRKIFDSVSGVYSESESMTVRGAINKTLVMFFLVAASAFFVWQKFFGAFAAEDPAMAVSAVRGYMFVGGFGGFVIAMIASFAPRKAAFFVPIYAILEGMFLGGLSATFEAMYPGLVIRAILLTFSVFFVMLMVYRQGIIKVTSGFKRGIIAAVGGVTLVYLISWIAGLLGFNFGLVNGTGSMSLIFSIIVVGIAAFSLMLDFDFVEKNAALGVPKYMEWYSAFGLMVSLVWLYINMLRLLAIFASNRD